MNPIGYHIPRLPFQFQTTDQAQKIVIPSKARKDQGNAFP